MCAVNVRVLFFGQLKEIVGLAQDEAELSEGARGCTGKSSGATR